MESQTLAGSSKTTGVARNQFIRQACADFLPCLWRHLPAEYPVLSEALTQLTGDLALQHQPPGSSFSRLTNQGYPLELAYVWPARSFRFTADLLPGALPLARLQHSLNYIGGISNPQQLRLVERLEGWLGKYGGKYGAWVGGRCNQNQMHYKLYVEVAKNAPWQEWEEEIVGSACTVVPGLRLVMIGIDPVSAEVEFYYRMDGLNLPALRSLQLRYQLPDRSPEMTQMLHAICQRHIRFEIPSANLGYSVSFNTKQEAQAFTLYSIANSMLGEDVRIRSNVLRLGQDLGWDMDLYQLATQCLGSMQIHPGDTWHGMLGLVAIPQYPLQFTIGWTPISNSSNE
ncbi:hypothetical protein [Haliscomenobacter hydrossis]|uniref:Uncharacterized protein n=1 Tax=Haliscomenobacter hydrossis (strain ATCC 27775 / DSM 1100 / LMG 10767 / O) TaxID=760192 RepID=F4KYF3_HALH1|nr:hypothetical protein [Haliscomenobacter hydrossis]AEE49394.1 hypothetical protein Halhy_1501 [Haliscomenobacter hydrossis DSM 1100]